MANRYFQCKFCKKLIVLDNVLCYVSNPEAEIKDQVTVPDNLDNEICNCKVNGNTCKRRLRELSQPQYNMETALNRAINQG